MQNFLIKELITSFRNHNVEVFPVLYEKFQKLIDLYSYRIGNEDAHQELTLFFLELLYAVDINRFPSDNSTGLARYIAVSIRNKYIELSKENTKYRSLVSQLCDDCILNESENYESCEVLDLLTNLSERQKAVIMYKYIYKYSDAEISEILGISRQAVNRLKNRGLEQLRELC